MVYNMMHNATGPWTGCSYQDTAKYATGEEGKIFVSESDREILRKLAGRVADLAVKEKQQEKIKLWKDHNTLKTKRPVVFCDPENGWNDIIMDDILQCHGNLARRWELILRKELFWGEELKDDKPVGTFFNVGYTYTESDWAGEKDLVRGGTGGGSYIWEAPIKDIGDIDKIRVPEIEVDYKVTNDTLELAQEVFEGLLEVRLKGIWWWSLGFTFDLVKLIGLEKMLMLFYDDPELVHSVNKKISEGYEAKLKFLEDNSLLYLNNDGTYVGSGGLGYSDEMPAHDFDESKVRPVDMWVHSESQETSSVSPEMFDEFIFRYQLPIIEKFAMACYGCCEPLDKRWKIIKKIPNLRRVSISHWADNRKMAEYLQDKYIYSMKPTPADLAVPEIDADHIREKMTREMEITNGCIVEVIMKDNHTLGKNPQNLVNWVRIMRQVIDKVYG